MKDDFDLNWERVGACTLRLTRSDDRTHLRVPFEVGEGFRALQFHTAYAPKYSDDEASDLRLLDACFAHCAPEQGFGAREARLNLPLRNHIAWSIDGPDGLLGTEHRHNPDQTHTIAPDFASCGFRPAPIAAGVWTVTASINALVCDAITVTIEVEGLR